MTLAEIILFVILVICAVIFGKKGKTIPMIGCIAVAVVMAFLLIATLLLLNGID